MNRRQFPQGLFNGLELLPNHRIVASIEYFATVGLDHQADTIDKSISQGLHCLLRSDWLSRLRENPSGG